VYTCDAASDNYTESAFYQSFICSYASYIWHFVTKVNIWKQGNSKRASSIVQTSPLTFAFSCRVAALFHHVKSRFSIAPPTSLTVSFVHLDSYSHFFSKSQSRMTRKSAIECDR
jgi:hypothetical protein